MKPISPLCCGKPRRTIHCPDCGKRLVPDGPLGQLLLHCLTQQVKHSNKADEYKKASFECEDAICREERTSLKWKTWADALKGIMGFS